MKVGITKAYQGLNLNYRLAYKLQRIQKLHVDAGDGDLVPRARLGLGQTQVKRMLCTTPKGIVFEKKPFKVEVVEGKIYSWCSCGRSSKQPFCDGTHKFDPVTKEKMEPPFLLKPIKVKVEESKTVYFCNCKQTKNPPFCDGSHKQLE